MELEGNSRPSVLLFKLWKQVKAEVHDGVET
jgi:hypothetical protein